MDRAAGPDMGARDLWLAWMERRENNETAWISAGLPAF